MNNDDSKGQQTLIEKVLNRGICVKCEACVGLCPYFNYWDGEVIALDACQAGTGSASSIAHAPTMKGLLCRTMMLEEREA